ncbi:putative inner membrane protein [Hartmannibacter diazotrophicus]|uniref:Putative inner membrane protein n=1 Tax=Hartmannibacter diazotrophicus TaxID=1482074 RepID=A0A2C9DB84_9HYPH|nr:YeeE/YedE family protein [Hartmannibacter diazotrophicus]SON57439.1 putative inner membrane protein [Hartmannibacter diazotrophicus]
MDFAGSEWFPPIAGLMAGLVMGYAARRHHFCTLAALERHWYAGDNAGVRTWVLAAATALCLSQILQAFGLANLDASIYLANRFAWTGAIIGGLAFGFGMALVGTCGFGALVRLGGGSLRSLVVLLVLGLSALAAQRGLIALGRLQVVDNLAADMSFVGNQSLGSILSTIAGHDIRTGVAAVVTIALMAWIFRDAAYRKDWPRIATGTTIGAAVAFGWLVTTLAARHSMDPVQIESASFVVPVADAILQIVTYTGVLPDYGVGLVVGVGVGAAICARRQRDVRWEACDDARELSRHLVGGFLMGTGGVFAMGCTIGQGVSAFSTMAISAPLALASIALGARIGLAYLLEGTPLSPFSALTSFARTAFRRGA